MKTWILALLFCVATPAVAQDYPSGYRLPDGKLQLVSGNEKSARFLAVDQTRPQGKKIEIWLYVVFEPALTIGDWSIVQSVERKILDCETRTYQDWGSVSYNNDDKVLGIAVPHDDYDAKWERFPPDHAMEFIARVVCDGALLPPQNLVSGHAKALQLGRVAIRQGRPTS